MHWIHITCYHDHPCLTSALLVQTSCRSSIHSHSTGCLAIQLQPSVPGRRRIVVTSWPSLTAIFVSPGRIWQNSCCTWTTMPPISPTAPPLTMMTSHLCRPKRFPFWRGASGRHWRRWTAARFYIYMTGHLKL